jgi:hypothetical protein
LPLVAESSGREQYQRGTHTLAATVDDVLGNLSNQYNVRMKTISNDRINGLHVGPNKGIKLFQGHDKRFLS